MTPAPHPGLLSLQRGRTYTHTWNPAADPDGPARWRSPRIARLTLDLFSPQVPDTTIGRVYATMALHDQHIYQVVTAHAARMRALLGDVDFLAACGSHAHIIVNGPPGRRDRNPAPLPVPLCNVWVGVQTCDQAQVVERVPHLLAAGAAVRLLQAIPLAGSIGLDAILCPDCGGKGTWGGFSHLHGCDMDVDCGAGKGAGLLDWVVAGGGDTADAQPRTRTGCAACAMSAPRRACRSCSPGGAGTGGCRAPAGTRRPSAGKIMASSPSQSPGGCPAARWTAVNGTACRGIIDD